MAVADHLPLEQGLRHLENIALCKSAEVGVKSQTIYHENKD